MDDGHGAGVAASNRREDLLVRYWREKHNEHRLFGDQIEFERVEPVGGDQRYEYMEHYPQDDGDEIVTFATTWKRFTALIEVKSVRFHKPFFRFKSDDVNRYIKNNRPVLHIQYCESPAPKMRWFFPEDLKKIETLALDDNGLPSGSGPITADIFSSRCPETHYEDYKPYYLLSQKSCEDDRWVDFRSLSPANVYMRDLKKLLTEYAITKNL